MTDGRDDDTLLAALREALAERDAVPRAFLEDLIAERGTKRLRLLPPYREHLSQAFARFFMRVGLPVDIPPFR